MKNISDIDQHTVTTLRHYFSGQPVVKAWLFGSLSRGEETPESDVDIIVSFDPQARVGIFKHIAMIEELEDIMHRAVDLVTEGTLYPWVKESVEQDKILIYERETA